MSFRWMGSPCGFEVGVLTFKVFSLRLRFGIQSSGLHVLKNFNIFSRKSGFDKQVTWPRY